MRALVPILAVAALLGPSMAQAQTTTLYGFIQGGAISLRDGSGSPVTQVAAGTYTFEVADSDTIHNFHLVGTSVDTPIDGTGTFTYTGIALGAGTHTYLCDIHPEIYGTFIVGASTLGPTASIARVSVAKVRGVRVVTVSLRVKRPAKVRTQLLRRGRIVGAARRDLSPGLRAMRIRLPQRAPTGLYTLRVLLTDIASGERSRLTRTIRIRLEG